ncbi:hypothetical protein Hypma_000484 [Hypsizygus marmoreus]|uniref:Uncharacterized protein n=1 Tax=Hypsizygus marmoreus TaxID=39966 RepID=A0A369JEN6_HYPMA|nr:hypothetical protein Hypma_000484 [Hypsizygus marmoreus]
MPYYATDEHLKPVSVVTHGGVGTPAQDVPKSHWRAAHTPSGLSFKSEHLIVKVQVPYNFSLGVPLQGTMKLLIYSKKRDFVCHIRRQDNVSAYDRISHVVRSQGLGGGKAYFAAELRSKSELVVKVSEVLAEQPF